MIGNDLWAWQVEEQPDVWSAVGAIIPGTGLHSPLIHRNREVAEKVMKPVAEAHAAKTGLPLRLAHFILEEVVG